MTLVWACLAMALRDCFATLLVICEARGRALLAGLLDAAGDLASILVTVLAAGQIILHGWSAHSIVVLAAVMLTSFAGTALWTRVGQRIEPSHKPDRLV